MAMASPALDSQSLGNEGFLGKHNSFYPDPLNSVKFQFATSNQSSFLPEASKESLSQTRRDALSSLLEKTGGVAVVDGGLATELERRGANVNDPLYSSKCLLDEESSALIREVHLDYFRAGADIGSSASYQATIEGFIARGFDHQQAEGLLLRSVELVCEARDAFWQECLNQSRSSESNGSNEKVPRQRGLVAASIGPYGAYLADGSEYSGDYGPTMTVEKLMDFHQRRLQVLGHSGADIIAFETIPSLQETEALVRLLDKERLPIPAWISFNSKDGLNGVRGDPFESCVKLASSSKHVVAVGINCTAPRYIHSLVTISRKATDKPIIVYPNIGEEYDPVRKEWVESTGVKDEAFVSYAPFWREAGANILGGCCRTTPNTIRGIRTVLYGLGNS